MRSNSCLCKIQFVIMDLTLCFALYFFQESGYQLLFLSAPAIVQAYLTRSFLNNLKQVRLEILFTFELALNR